MSAVVTPAATTGALVSMRGVVKSFPAGGKRQLKAVAGVDLDIAEGTAVGLVGESGSGKTTLGRCLLRLTDVSAGSIAFAGTEITRMTGQPLRRLRARMQMVFQDPLGSLDPRQTVASIVEEPLILLTDADERERRRRVLEMLERVRLTEAHLSRYPHQLSGGQQQRVGIARALVTGPRLCVLDEPTSALDWPIRAQMLELLDNLRADLGLSYLVISHDLEAVRRICDRIAVMYLGRIVEDAPARRALHPPAASIHQGAAVGPAGAGSRHSPHAQQARRGVAEPDRPSARMPAASALPDRQGGVLGDRADAHARVPRPRRRMYARDRRRGHLLAGRLDVQRRARRGRRRLSCHCRRRPVASQERKVRELAHPHDEMGRWSHSVGGPRTGSRCVRRRMATAAAVRQPRTVIRRTSISASRCPPRPTVSTPTTSSASMRTRRSTASTTRWRS